MLSVTHGFFAGRCLPRMLLAVSVTAVLKLLIKASILSWFSRMRSAANFPPIVAWKISAMLGSLSFSRLNLILMLPWFFTLWRRSLKVIITNSWSQYRLLEAPGLCNVHTWLEASFDHDVVHLTVVVSSWAVPCPASGWFVWTKCVHHEALIHIQIHVRGIHTHTNFLPRFRQIWRTTEGQ